MANNRKRKADDDAGDSDIRMSASPSSSPSLPNQSLPLQPSAAGRNIKRLRTNITGRPLAVSRLLETLDLDETRTLLRSLVERHPGLERAVTSLAPRPSVSSVMTILHNYESELRNAFPFGGSQSSDYAYNRVRQALVALMDALKDYTPHFLPPNETQATTSLEFLDGATEVIHRLPNWDSYANTRHKSEAYEEMAKAWAAVLREAAKRGGGIQLLNGGWDQKIARHNEVSGGKMEEAVNELRTSLDWMGGAGFPGQIGAGQGEPSVRQQLLSGTYGLGGSAVRVGPW